ncbi:hypothetical protein Zmor_012442 [Zophobas morio]|uniref:Uncharacterized protein n=1 Tax=Zophobas morio TaxID=2755281 RepID=A0AA38IDB1_9CUCU|nr:hypothetical protein Zmor_012442 [Zophobas morio]
MSGLQYLLHIKCYWGCLILHGLKVESRLLEVVFLKYGYCNLFKLLLHLDIEVDKKGPGIKEDLLFKNPVVHFICDVNWDLDLFIENCSYFYSDELFEYFAGPEMSRVISTLAEMGKVSEEVLKSAKINLGVPLLIEMARNVFRSYFVDIFHITTTKQLCSLLNGLPIDVVYKKIIALETKLYQT